MSTPDAAESSGSKTVIEAALDRYIAAGTTYTTRVVHGWLNEVRAHYTPFAQDSWEANLEGYSVDGAISRWAFTEINWGRPHVTYDLPENPSPAELERIVYHKPPEAVLDEILPLAEPGLSAYDIAEEQAVLQQCIEKSGVPADQIPYPEEYFHLISLTWYINAAGIPSHVQDETIFAARLRYKDLLDGPWELQFDQVRKQFPFEIAVAWQINSFANDPQGDEVYYACCRARPPAVEAAVSAEHHPFKWRVLKRRSFFHMATFESFAEYLDSESEHLEAAMRSDPKSDDWIEHYRDPNHPDYEPNGAFPWPGQPRWADRQPK